MTLNLDARQMTYLPPPLLLTNSLTTSLPSKLLSTTPPHKFNYTYVPTTSINPLEILCVLLLSILVCVKRKIFFLYSCADSPIFYGVFSPAKA